METCVLIPQEFALVVTQTGARNSAEPSVSVWTTTRIPQGSLCYPFQGTVRLDKIDVFSYIDEDDVSEFFFSKKKISVFLAITKKNEATMILCFIILIYAIRDRYRDSHHEKALGCEIKSYPPMTMGTKN